MHIQTRDSGDSRTEPKTLRWLLNLMHETSLIHNIHGHRVSVHVLKLAPPPPRLPKIKRVAHIQSPAGRVN